MWTCHGDAGALSSSGKSFRIAIGATAIVGCLVYARARHRAPEDFLHLIAPVARLECADSSADFRWRD